MTSHDNDDELLDLCAQEDAACADAERFKAAGAAIAADQALIDAANLRIEIALMRPTTLAGWRAQMKLALFDLDVAVGDDVEMEVQILNDGLDAIAEILDIAG